MARTARAAEGTWGRCRRWGSGRGWRFRRTRWDWRQSACSRWPTPAWGQGHLGPKRQGSRGGVRLERGHPARPNKLQRAGRPPISTSSFAPKSEAGRNRLPAWQRVIQAGSQLYTKSEVTLRPTYNPVVSSGVQQPLQQPLQQALHFAPPAPMVVLFVKTVSGRFLSNLPVSPFPSLAPALAPVAGTPLRASGSPALGADAARYRTRDTAPVPVAPRAGRCTPPGRPPRT